jgi:hypothetical protein
MGNGNTIGQRNFFFPEMNSQSKSRERNHSHLERVSMLALVTGYDDGDGHVETDEGVHELDENSCILFDLFRGFPVGHGYNSISR